MIKKYILSIIKKSIFLLFVSTFFIVLNSCNNKYERNKLDMKATSKIFFVQPEIAKKLYPNGYNLKIAKEKEISNNSIYESKYLLLQSGYRAIFNEFLCKNTKIDEYQKKLDTSEFNFPQSLKSEYSKIGAFGRKNIYLRNSLYVERLSDKDIELIFQAIDDDVIEISEELLLLVDRTWKEIITVYLDSHADEEPYEIIYDEGGINKTVAFNDSLVFELNYDVDFDPAGNIIDKENEKFKYQYATNLANQMEEEIANKLNCHVAVIIKG